MPHPSYSLRQLSAGEGSALIADLSCGECEHCTSGFSLWCAAPDEANARVAADVRADLAESLIQSLLATAALASIPAAAFDHSPVVAIGDSAAVVATFARRVVPGPILTARDSRDESLREHLAQAHASGRPRVAISGDSLRAAVRLTRRGGFACGPLDTGALPSVTELVQREVTVPEARSVRELLASLTPQDWTDASATAVPTH